MTEQHRDLPREEVVKRAEQVIALLAHRGQRARVYFKFTCGHCGARQTFDKPNSIFADGTCEACGETTKDIPAYGYLLESERVK